jgi:hypothetical protein
MVLNRSPNIKNQQTAKEGPDFHFELLPAAYLGFRLDGNLSQDMLLTTPFLQFSGNIIWCIPTCLI